MQCTITDTTNQLQTCVDSSSTIEIDLKTCQSNSGNCLFDLEATKERLRISQTTVTELQEENDALDADVDQCEADLSELRCHTNVYLGTVQKSQEGPLEALLKAAEILSDTKDSIQNFIVDNDITCPALLAAEAEAA